MGFDVSQKNHNSKEKNEMYEKHLNLRNHCTYSTLFCQSAFVRLIHVKQMCCYTSANIKQRKANRQIAEYLMQNIWQWEILLMLSFCISFIRLTPLMLCEPELTSVKKRVRKSFLWQICLVRNSGVLTMNTHTQKSGSQKQHLVVPALQVSCFDLV